MSAKEFLKKTGGHLESLEEDFLCRYRDSFAFYYQPLWQYDSPQCHSVTLYAHISCTVSNICTDEFVNMFVLVSLYLFPWLAFTCLCCYCWGTYRKIQLPILMNSVSRLLVVKGKLWDCVDPLQSCVHPGVFNMFCVSSLLFRNWSLLFVQNWWQTISTQKEAVCFHLEEVQIKFETFDISPILDFSFRGRNQGSDIILVASWDS